MKPKIKVVYPAVIFIFSFLIYIFTTAPDLTFTDSGELASVCTTLGIAHPTGYPLFTLLGHLWTYLPFFNTEIYSLNIFAGFITAISAMVFFYTVLILLRHINNIPSSKKQQVLRGKKSSKYKEIKNPGIQVTNVAANKITENSLLLISISTSLLYAFARTIWAQAVAIEVYSLHLLMLNLVLLFLFKAIFDEGNRKIYWICTAMLLGISFTNHMTTILLIPMILILYIWETSGKNKIQNANFELSKDGKKSEEGYFINGFMYLPFLVATFLFGISLYLYLPIRSANMPEFNWGWVSRSFEKFWYHFSGKQYQVWMFSDSAIWKENLIKFFNLIPEQITWLGFIPLIIGFYATFIRSKKLFLSLIILIIACISYAINYSIHDIDSYFVTAFIGLIIFVSFGLWQIAKFFPKSVYAFLILPLIAFAINYNYNDRSDDWIVPEYTTMVLQKLEPDALILSSQWDFWLSAAWYKQRVEKFRKDVIIIDKELLRRTWYVEQLKRWYPKEINKCSAAIDDYLLDLELFESGEVYNPTSIQSKFIKLLRSIVAENYEKHPVYITLDALETEPDAFEGYDKAATGFAFKLVRDKSPQIVKASDIKIDKFVKSIYSNEGYLVDAIKSTAAINLVNLGRYALMQGNKKEARIAVDKAYKIDSKNKFVLEAINYFDNIRFED